MTKNKENIKFNKFDFFNLEDLDLFIKFLYVKAKVEGNNYDFYKKLYEKAILRFFWWVNDGKSKISEFISAFDDLIESMQKKWFDKKYPIILSENNMILNGRHRIAVSQYLDIDPVFEIKNDIGHKRFIMDLNFYRTIFSDFEIETIIIDYLNSFENEDYFLTFLWWDSENKWDYIKDTFQKNTCIISYEKVFNFKEKNYFENILEWIYTHENGIKQNGNIFIKTEGLKKNMKFKLILFKYEKEKSYRYINNGFPICVEVENIKFQIRKDLSLDSTEKNYAFLIEELNKNQHLNCIWKQNVGFEYVINNCTCKPEIDFK